MLIKSMLYRLFTFAFSMLISPIMLITALISRLKKGNQLNKNEFRILWGTDSLTNYVNWSRAMAENGWKSRTAVGVVSSHSAQSDFDEMIFSNRSNKQITILEKIFIEFRDYFFFIRFFMRTLTRENLVVVSCTGLVFSHFNVGLLNYKTEFRLLKIAGIKVCVIPYGGDAHVYRRLRNPNWMTALAIDYSEQSKLQNKIAARVDYYVAHSDVFLPGGAVLDGFGRSDRISVNTLCIDTTEWAPVTRKKNGQNLVITHTPNHRGVKGTAAVIQTVDLLRAEGLSLELRLVEGKSNKEVREFLREFSDIHIDQLNSDLYGLSAIESMSLGIPTISSFEGELRNFFDRWSFSKECPIISANPSNLTEVLRNVIADSNSWQEISRKSREYVKKYHSYESFETFFAEIIKSNGWIV